MSLNDSQYIPGEVARLSLTVTDLDGLVADPGAVEPDRGRAEAGLERGDIEEAAADPLRVRLGLLPRCLSNDIKSYLAKISFGWRCA